MSWACTSQHCIRIPATNHVRGNLMPSEHGAHCCLSFAAARDLICVNPEFQHVTSQSYRFRLAQVARPSLVLLGQTASAENTFKSNFFFPLCTNLYKIIQLNIPPPIKIIYNLPEKDHANSSCAKERRAFFKTISAQIFSFPFDLFHRKVFSSFNLILVINKPTNGRRQAGRQANMKLWQG